MKRIGSRSAVKARRSPTPAVNAAHLGKGLDDEDEGKSDAAVANDRHGDSVAKSHGDPARSDRDSKQPADSSAGKVKESDTEAQGHSGKSSASTTRAGHPSHLESGALSPSKPETSLPGNKSAKREEEEVRVSSATVSSIRHNRSKV